MQIIHGLRLSREGWTLLSGQIRFHVFTCRILGERFATLPPSHRSTHRGALIPQIFPFFFGLRRDSMKTCYSGWRSFKVVLTRLNLVQGETSVSWIAAGNCAGYWKDQPGRPSEKMGEERPRPARVGTPGPKLCPNIASIIKQRTSHNHQVHSNWSGPRADPEAGRCWSVSRDCMALPGALVVLLAARFEAA